MDEDRAKLQKYIAKYEKDVAEAHTRVTQLTAKALQCAPPRRARVAPGQPGAWRATCRTVARPVPHVPRFMLRVVCAEAICSLPNSRQPSRHCVPPLAVRSV
jgi:hypothetical protein